MYSPTTRLLAVLELLQSRQQISGAELAQRLEVTPRTVRRYIQQLQDMGIAVEAERGTYGAYRLKPAQRVPPLVFTEADTVALTVGLLMMRECEFPVDRALVETTLAKIERMLPGHLIQHARAIQATIRLQAGSHSLRIEHGWLMPLSLAVLHQQQVQLSYLSSTNQRTKRTINPYGIVVNEGAWYMVGYCQLRKAIRVFRLDRIDEIHQLEHSFERPKSIDLLEVVRSALYTAHGQDELAVILKTSLTHAQQLIPSHLGTLEATPHGVIWRRAAVHLEWVALVLLELDIPVVVVQPAALRTQLQRMATKALAMIEPWEYADQDPTANEPYQP